MSIWMPWPPAESFGVWLIAFALVAMRSSVERCGAFGCALLLLSELGDGGALLVG